MSCVGPSGGTLWVSESQVVAVPWSVGWESSSGRRRTGRLGLSVRGLNPLFGRRLRLPGSVGGSECPD